jgi:hypothetical protein
MTHYSCLSKLTLSSTAVTSTTPHAAGPKEVKAETLCWPLVHVACKHRTLRVTARDTLLASSKLKPALWAILEWILKEAAAIRGPPVDKVWHARPLRQAANPRRGYTAACPWCMPCVHQRGVRLCTTTLDPVRSIFLACGPDCISLPAFLLTRLSIP